MSTKSPISKNRFAKSQVVKKTQQPPPSKSNFTALKAKYRLSSPEHVQMRILWITLKALVIDAFGDTPRNKKILKAYDSEWQACETELTRISKNRNRKTAKSILSIVLIFCSFISLAQGVRNGYISFSGGLSFPVGEFADKDAGSRTSGLAKAGTIGDITFAHAFGKSKCGYVVSLRAGDYGFSSEQLENELGYQLGGNWAVTSESYSFIGIYAGGYRTSSIAEKFLIDSKFMIGYIDTSFPNPQFSGLSGTNFISGGLTSDGAGTFSYLVGIGLRLKFNQKYGMTFGADYFSAAPEFDVESIATSSSGSVIDRYRSKQKISVISCMVGFVVHVR